MNTNQAVARLGTLLLAAALTACGTGQVRIGTTADGTADVSAKGASTALGSSVEERATRRWQLLIDGKPDLAYDYLSPGYRQTRGRQEYSDLMRSRPVRWVGVAFQDQDCDGEVCKVRLMISYSLDMPVQMVGRVESVDFVTENWLWIDDGWYYLPATDAQRGLR